MNKIPSFTVNHLKLLPGAYVSRTDTLGEHTLTTFDIRVTRPNLEPVMDTCAAHAVEHLGATFLRNDERYAEKTVYFGPMGCRTGFYLILKGALTPADIKPLLCDLFDFIINYTGEIPGAAAKDCGNYLDLNLSMAKFYAQKYKREALSDFTEKRTVYPE